MLGLDLWECLAVFGNCQERSVMNKKGIAAETFVQASVAPLVVLSALLQLRAGEAILALFGGMLLIFFQQHSTVDIKMNRHALQRCARPFEQL